MKSMWWMAAASALLAGAALSAPGLARAGDTVISGPGNGVGNRIAVSGGPGTTVIRGSRWGVGNTIKVENAGSSVVIDDEGVTIDGVTLPRAATSCPPEKGWTEEEDSLFWGA